MEKIMENVNSLPTIPQIAKILGVNESTLRALQYLKAEEDKYKSRKKHKGYNLVKVPNKKHGFLYYVRYTENGRLIPSRWNTHTTIREDAEQFAEANRLRLIESYRTRDKAPTLYTILEAYYQENSPYLAIDRKRNRVLGKKTRSVYRNFIKKIFIPYLKAKQIHTFSEVTPPVIAGLQNMLLQKGKKPQTINRYLGCAGSVFSHLLMTGVLRENIFSRIKPLRSRKKDSRVRGCYDIDIAAGVFKTPWEDRLSYLLCLVIYSTGLRNSEIERLRAGDITRVGKHYFLNIRESKTENGIRIVPLHPFVRKQLEVWIEGTGKTAGEYLFTLNGGHNQSTLYKKANLDMGARLGKSAAELEERGISFYSGRHYWKTLMNAGGLGEDIEEYFMGHKVSGDVSRRYNHKDRQGRDRLEEKVSQVFSILDKKLFKGK
jgi:integrase